MRSLFNRFIWWFFANAIIVPWYFHFSPSPSIHKNKAIISIKVVKGDTIIGILARHGFDQSFITEVVRLNNWLRDPDIIKPGQQLLLPINIMNNSIGTQYSRQSNLIAAVSALAFALFPRLKRRSQDHPRNYRASNTFQGKDAPSSKSYTNTKNARETNSGNRRQVHTPPPPPPPPPQPPARSMAMTTTLACHVLGLSEIPSPQQLKRAYRLKAQEHHPDLGGDHDRMAEINAAYAYLLDKD